MQAYGIGYSIRGKKDKDGNLFYYDRIVEAKDTASAKRKLGKLHGYKDGRQVIIHSCYTIGYF